MDWYVYILQSTITGRLYTGVSTDPDRRLIEHNTSRKGAKATRAGRPWVIIYREGPTSKGEALRREYRIKQLKRSHKLCLKTEELRNPSGIPPS